MLNNQKYTLVDTSGESLSSCSDYFVKDAILTVIIDTVNMKATLLNPRVNTYTKTLGTPNDSPDLINRNNTVWARVKRVEEDILDLAPKEHTHTRAEITDFGTHTHDDRYYTEGEIDNKLDEKAPATHKHKRADIEDFYHNHMCSSITDFPTLVSHFKNDARYLTEETDPTVPSWAKKPTKPSYTIDEIETKSWYIPESDGYIHNAIDITKVLRGGKTYLISLSTREPSFQGSYYSFVMTLPEFKSSFSLDTYTPLSNNYGFRFERTHLGAYELTFYKQIIYDGAYAMQTTPCYDISIREI
jgi:hypothetical protein